MPSSRAVTDSIRSWSVAAEFFDPGFAADELVGDKTPRAFGKFISDSIAG